jgi:hypothetical protein
MGPAPSGTHTTYNDVPLSSRMDMLGRLIAAITIIGNPDYTQECEELCEDTERLTLLQEALTTVLSDNPEAPLYDNSDVIKFINRNKHKLTKICTALYSQALRDIMADRTTNVEDELSLEQHPITVYAQFLDSLSNAQFLPMPDEDILGLIAPSFNFCCKKIYTECSMLEEQIDQNKVTRLVDCMWYTNLLTYNQDAIIYVLGSWRFSRMIDTLEELRERYSDQPLTESEAKKMREVLKSLTTPCDKSCCYEENKECNTCRCCDDDYMFHKN